MNRTRLLLIEFYFADRYSQFRTKNYPFLLGQARALGAEAEWHCCWAPPDKDSRTRYVMNLDDRASSGLLAAVREFDPTHIMFSEKLSDSLEQAMTRSFPSVKIENLAGASLDRLTAWPADWLPDWLSMGPDDRFPPSTYLVDRAQPAYECTAVNHRPGTTDPPIHVTAGNECIYTRKLSRNPFFKDIDVPEGFRPVACSFCVGPDKAAYVFETPPVELAARQCVAALTTADRCTSRDTYVVDSAYLFMKIRPFFEGILKHPFPPSLFFFGCRIDELVRKGKEIEGLLPEISRAGHSINVYNMGIENFSPDENDRLNKGLSLQTLKDANELITRLESRFPAAFQFTKWGGYGFILFTPWTTCDDLEINLKHMPRWRGVDAEGFTLTSKLQILTESAVYLLAKKDGLLADSFEDFHYYDSGCIFRWDQQEVPWRFQHPQIGHLYKIACRISPLTEFPEDDRLLSEIQKAYAVARKCEKTPFDFFEQCVQAARQGSMPGSPEEILDRVRERFVEPMLEEMRATAEAARAEDEGPEDFRDEADEPTAGEEQPSARVLRAQQILEQLAHGADIGLSGFTPDRVWEKKGPGGTPELVIELRRGEERLTLHLLKRQPDIPAFLATRRFLVRYSDGAPVDTADKQDVAWIIAAYMERYGTDLESVQDDGSGIEPVVPVGADEILRMVEPFPGK